MYIRIIITKYTMNIFLSFELSITYDKQGKFRMSKRKIPKNYRNITGKIGSNKALHGFISFESKLERDFYFLFDYLPQIKIFDDQPLTIEYEFQGKDRSYTPDFLLTLNDGSHILGEVKYRNELMEKFDEFEHKFRAAIEYCKQKKNWTFRIFTERCSYLQNEDLFWNIRFLLDYDHIDPQQYQNIYNAFSPFIRLDELLAKISPDPFVQMGIVPTLWALVRHKKIKADLNTKLSLYTILESIDEP